MTKKSQNVFFNQGVSVTHRQRAWASRLLDQQLWCFGRDIVKPSGNVLLRQGFTRHKPNASARCHSCYRLVESEMRMSLWGFGIWFSFDSLGSIFLKRRQFAPQWSDDSKMPEMVWHAHELTGFGNPEKPIERSMASVLLERLCLWLAEYERKIVEKFGLDYRRGVVFEWDCLRKPTLPAESLSSYWLALAHGDWDVFTESQQQAA